MKIPFVNLLKVELQNKLNYTRVFIFKKEIHLKSLNWDLISRNSWNLAPLKCSSDIFYLPLTNNIFAQMKKWYSLYERSIKLYPVLAPGLWRGPVSLVFKNNSFAKKLNFVIVNLGCTKRGRRLKWKCSFGVT